jgi:hypothetical protein
MFVESLTWQMVRNYLNVVQNGIIEENEYSKFFFSEVLKSGNGK